MTIYDLWFHDILYVYYIYVYIYRVSILATSNRKSQCTRFSMVFHGFPVFEGDGVSSIWISRTFCSSPGTTCWSWSRSTRWPEDFWMVKRALCQRQCLSSSVELGPARRVQRGSAEKFASLEQRCFLMPQSQSQALPYGAPIFWNCELLRLCWNWRAVVRLYSLL